MILRTITLTILLLAAVAQAQPVVTEIIPTTRDAEELLAVLQPLTGDDVSAQAYRGQIILRGNPARVAELRGILAQLDRPVQNLRISVRSRDHGSSAGTDARVRAGSGQTELNVQQHNRQTRSDDEQSLVLMEGAVAALALDRDIPVLTVAPSGAVSGGFVPLGNVLELKPALAGEQVRLEIRQRHAQLNGPAIDSSSVQSVLLLTPGVWTDLGALGSNGQDSSSRVDSSGSGQRNRAVGTRQLDWQVRVELLP